MEYKISKGFAPDEHTRIADLYWQAFSFKLGRVMGPDEKALTFLRHVIDPDHAIVARSLTGHVLGLAGFKTKEGSFVGGGLGDLVHAYGIFGALWRAATLSVVERPIRADTLLMDGICVDTSARGMGLGTALLDAIKDEARKSGKTKVRLDVIDINPRAKALYLREGFAPQGVESTGPFKYVFRFNSATQMIWTAEPT